MVNKVILVGKVVGQPNSQMSGENLMTRLRLETTETGNGKVFRTSHFINFFGQQASDVADKVTDGDIISVEGKIQNRKYEKNGENVFVTEVRPFRFEVLNFNDDCPI